jgi:hypothetical protein
LNVVNINHKLPKNPETKNIIKYVFLLTNLSKYKPKKNKASML